MTDRPEAATHINLPGASMPVRDRILAAAFAAFSERGFAQASTLDIATRAKVSKRELYALFGNKQQMLITCISERAQRMRLPHDWPAPRTRHDLQGALNKFGLVLLQEITDPDVIAVYRLAICESDRSPEIAQALETYGRQVSCAALSGMLVQARAAGLLPDVEPASMVGRFTSLLLQSTVLDLALGLAKRPGRAEIWRRAQDATQAFLTLYPTRP